MIINIPVNTIIILLTAHLIGDFLLQTDSFIEKKEKLSFLLIHALIHFLLVFILLGDFRNPYYALFISITHFFIDFIKGKLKSNNNNNLPIIIDQILHFLIIGLISWFLPAYFQVNLYWLEVFGVNFLFACIIFSGIILVTKTGDILISNFLQSIKSDLRWGRILPNKNQKKKWSSGKLFLGSFKGGKYIGLFERSIIYLLFLIGEPGSIGFLIAAKSIMRFNTISNTDNKEFIEYVLIGTLASFTFAILVSCLVKELLVYVSTLAGI